MRLSRFAAPVVAMGICLPLADCGSPAPMRSVKVVNHHAASWGTFNYYRRTLYAPTPVSLPGPVVQVATSNSTQYALLANGSVYAWGLGASGQLGDGARLRRFTNMPIRVRFPSGVKIASLPTDVMPYDTGLAIDTTGLVWGWGMNGAGELCRGNSRQQDVPVKVPLTGVTAVAGAGGHALYYAHGRLYACGDNANGDLGNDSTQPSTTPVVIPEFWRGSSIVALVASYKDSGALLADGRYFDWGLNNHGQLGDGTTVSSAVPVQVQLPLPVTRVAQGGDDSTNGQTLVILSDGSLRSWGDDGCGQLGDHNVATETSPIMFSPPRHVRYKQLATGGDTSYGVTIAGTVYSWGCSKYGEVGNGGTTTAFTPVAVETGVSLISSTANDVATVTTDS
jgi:alpha-tubulin suppressor-like RCC1 family protein